LVDLSFILELNNLLIPKYKLNRLTELDYIALKENESSFVFP